MDGEEVGDPARTDADLPPCDDPPAGLRCRGIRALGAEPPEEMLGSQGLAQALGRGGWGERQGKGRADRARGEQSLLRGLGMAA